MRTFETLGSMGPTYTITTSDTATALAALVLATADGRTLTAATFAFETANIRIAVDATPTQAGLGVLMYPGDVMRLVGRENLNGFKHISAGAGVHGKIQVMPEY